MSHYLEGYVRARQTLAEIERRPYVYDAAPERPDARALKRWLGHFAAMARRTLTPRPASSVRSRLSGA